MSRNRILTRVTPESWQRIQTLRDIGMSRKRIALALDLSERQVCDAIRRGGPPRFHTAAQRDYSRARAARTLNAPDVLARRRRDPAIDAAAGAKRRDLFRAHLGLTTEQFRDFLAFRAKKFNAAQRLSLVTTGRLP